MVVGVELVVTGASGEYSTGDSKHLAQSILLRLLMAECIIYSADAVAVHEKK